MKDKIILGAALCCVLALTGCGAQSVNVNREDIKSAVDEYIENNNIKGDTGEAGKDGIDGKDGDTPTFVINEEGHLIAVYSNGNTKDCGKVAKEENAEEKEYTTSVICLHGAQIECYDPCVSGTYILSADLDIDLTEEIKEAYSVECINLMNGYPSYAKQYQHWHYIIKK